MGQFGIGQAVKRTEDQRLLTGDGKYNDDFDLDRQTFAYIMRSPHAHAEILHIDTEESKNSQGVLLVLTGDDVRKDEISPMPCAIPIKNIDGSDRSDTYRPILAQGRVRHVGEPVVAVIAETLA